MVTWTQELKDAASAIASDMTRQDESRLSLARDIRERASELANRARVGATLERFQVDIVSQFRQRLDDPYINFAGAKAFEDAWGAAWEAGN